MLRKSLLVLALALAAATAQATQRPLAVQIKQALEDSTELRNLGIEVPKDIKISIGAPITNIIAMSNPFWGLAYATFSNTDHARYTTKFDLEQNGQTIHLRCQIYIDKTTRPETVDVTACKDGEKIVGHHVQHNDGVVSIGMDFDPYYGYSNTFVTFPRDR